MSPATTVAAGEHEWESKLFMGPGWDAAVMDSSGASTPRPLQPVSPFRPMTERARRRIAEATSNDDVVAGLRGDPGLCDFAEKIERLILRLADEPDEPQPDTESLKLLARAALADHRLRNPYVLALSEEGHVHAEWHFRGAKLFMTFRPTGHVKVVLVHPGRGEDPLRVAGTLYSTHTESFAKWLVSSLPW